MALALLLWISSIEAKKTAATVKKTAVAQTGAQTTCSSTSPDCCWVVQIWKLMGKSTQVSSTSSTACCSMTGVRCSGSAVTHLYWGNGLTNQIPEDIGNLRNLEVM